VPISAITAAAAYAEFFSDIPFSIDVYVWTGVLAQGLPEPLPRPCLSAQKASNAGRRPAPLSSQRERSRNARTLATGQLQTPGSAKPARPGVQPCAPKRRSTAIRM
jgi:hypothetical protein